MTSINPIYNINYAQAPLFKAKEESVPAPITNPISQPNLAFKGTEALAAYNYAKINQDKAFDIPELKLFDIPENINDIKGEKITNSAGELIKIIDENDTQKSEYYIRDNEVGSYLKTEKNTGVKWIQHHDMVIKKLPNGISYNTCYHEGKIAGKSKHIYYSEGEDLSVDYDVIRKEYSISKHYKKNGHQYSSFAFYDENKKCTQAFESRGFNDKISDLHLKDGVPYKISTQESTSLPNNIGKDDIDLTGLELDKPLVIDFEKVKNLEGQKKYYSNGQIEQIITPDGNIYNFALAGLDSIKIGNKEYQIYRDDDGKYLGQNIITDLGNGIYKRTHIDNYGKSVSIEKGYQLIKDVSYNDNGTISSYSDNVAGISKHFDKNGNLTNIWEREN